MSHQLILASSSPRRQELLKQVKIPFLVRKANIDESAITTSDPIEKVRELAILKGESVPLQQHEVVLSADTVVAYHKQIFEKPQSKEEAYEMMKTLNGTTHDVFTGVMIRSQEKYRVFVEKTEVEFWPLTEEEIEWYIETDEPYDKAGGYGIQSLGAIFIKRLIGDYYNVVGLPLAKVVRELRGFHIYSKDFKAK